MDTQMEFQINALNYEKSQLLQLGNFRAYELIIFVVCVRRKIDKK